MKGQTISTHFYTKKSLGQNFIYDMGFLNSVLDRLGITDTDTIVEIGTGKGTLTKCLAARAKRVITYEIDTRLTDFLTQEFALFDNISVLFGDFLTIFDPKNAQNYRVIANIPYYITTPIIMRLLGEPGCREICVLVQSEVANRIVAKPGTGEYGALSVTCQLLANCRIIRTVPRTMFRPMPNVESAFVVLEKNGSAPLGGFDAFIKGVFSKRRKKIRASIPQDVLDACGINADLRPEQISPNDFAKMYEKSRLSAKSL